MWLWTYFFYAFYEKYSSFGLASWLDVFKYYLNGVKELDLKMWGKIEFHCIQHSKVVQPTAEWVTGVLLLGALLSEVLNWCKMAVFWESKVEDCQHSPLSPPQDPQYAKRYLSQVSMKEYRKRVLAGALPFSSVFRWRNLRGEVISIHLFLSIYSVTSSQFISCKAAQPSLENHNFLIGFNLFPTLLSDTPSSSAGRCC